MWAKLIRLVVSEVLATKAATARENANGITVSLEITTDRNFSKFYVSIKAEKTVRQEQFLVLDDAAKAAIADLIDNAIAASKGQR